VIFYYFCIVPKLEEMKITTLPKVAFRATKLTLVFISMFLLQACPYESEFPVTGKEVTFPKEYLGTWYEKDGNYGVLDYKKYVFRELDDTTIYLDAMELNDNDKWEKTTYQCHISYVGDSRFINVKTLEKTNTNVYYLYNVEMEEDQMQIRGVTTNITKDFEEPDSLYQYIDKYKHLDFFYSEADTKTFTQWGEH